MSFEDRSFSVTDGLRLHYRDYPGDPAKPPLLCLHGLTRNARDFAEFAERY
jgi:pimeloyl-ACP methyl ester carboxylesterase